MNNELIIVIVNKGYSEVAMDSARSAGAAGGTIFSAKGTGAIEAKRLFGLSVSSDKELILILTYADKRNEIMNAICKSAGLNTLGRGIIFSVPVDHVLGNSNGFDQTNVTKQ